MENPSVEGGRVAVFYCSNDAAAKTTVASLIDGLRFEALDAGPLLRTRVLEPLAMLWISLAVKHGYGNNFGFELLRR